jgi:hypothetical protein
MVTNIARLSLVSIALLSASAVACGSKASGGGGDNTNGDSNAAAAASTQSQHMGTILFGSVSSSDPATAAGQVATGTQLWPAGCVTRAKDPTNPLLVHVTFNDCTGPFGLVHLNGGVDVVFSKNASGGLHAAHTSVNLTANGVQVTFSASADITVSGTTRSVAWQGNWNRTNEEGDVIVHTSNLTITIDTVAKCATTNGTAVTTVDAREVDSTINGYEVCEVGGIELCPKAGTITHTHKSSGRSVSVSFDGTNEATFTGPNGGTVKVQMVCGS